MSPATIAPTKARTRLGPSSNGTLMTSEEFDRVRGWPRGYRFELINGVVIVSPPPDVTERGPNDLLGWMLENYRRTHPQGRALEETFPEQPVRTANRRIADRAIWLGPNPAQSLKDIFPDIIVEFPSRRRRDRRRDYELKREEYLGAGAREYWVIDRFQRTMTVFRRAPEGVAERVLKENDSYRTDLLPGFELALSLVFEHVDRVRWRFS